MERLSQRDCSSLMGATAELYNLKESALLPDVLLQRLMRIIPSEFTGYHVSHRNEEKVIPFYRPAKGSFPCFHKDFWALAESHPLTPVLRSHHSHAWMASDVISMAAFRRSDFYNVLYRPIGIDHELVMMIPVSPDHSSMMILSLHRKHASFSERDRTMLNLLAPHIGRIQKQLKIGQARSIQETSTETSSTSLRQFAESVEQTTWRLNPREVEVLYWLSRGKTNAEIGIVLGISARTAETHALNIYPKIGVENRYGAIVEVTRVVEV